MICASIEDQIVDNNQSQLMANDIKSHKKSWRKCKTLPLRDWEGGGEGGPGSNG